MKPEKYVNNSTSWLSDYILYYSLHFKTTAVHFTATLYCDPKKYAFVLCVPIPSSFVSIQNIIKVENQYNYFDDGKV